MPNLRDDHLHPVGHLSPVYPITQSSIPELLRKQSVYKTSQEVLGSNSAVPRVNPRDSRYKFSLHPPFLKQWYKKDPGKDGLRKPSCFSDFPTFFAIPPTFSVLHLEVNLVQPIVHCTLYCPK
jgi:hypothetical protein